MSIEDQLNKLKIKLPNAPAPVGSYAAFKKVNNLVFISGQISIDENGKILKGKVGQDLKLEDGESKDFQVRIRYRQPLQNATLYQTKDSLFISFYEAQSSITSGQFAAWYIKDELIGSGVIN